MYPNVEEYYDDYGILLRSLGFSFTSETDVDGNETVTGYDKLESYLFELLFLILNLLLFIVG